MSEDISLMPDASSEKSKNEKEKKSKPAPVLVGPEKEKKGVLGFLKRLFKK